MTLNFRSELDHLATRVDRHPLTEMLAYDVRPPATIAHVHDVEKEFGSPIPASVRELYQNANGVSLRWRIKDDTLDETLRRELSDELMSFYPAPEDMLSLAGAIEIVPLEDALLHRDYTLLPIGDQDNTFFFDGVTYTDDEFCRMLRIFDAVTDDVAMAYVTQPGQEEWKLMWLTGGWAAYDSSRVTWLGDYLRLAIATWGLISARDTVFNQYEGHLTAPVVFEQQLATSLVPPTFLSA